MFACSGDGGSVPTDAAVDTDDTTPPGDDDDDTTPDSTGSTDTGPVVPTADTAPELDCSILPPLPVTWQTYEGWGTAEDFDIDALGFHVSILSRDLLAQHNKLGTEVRSPNVTGSQAAGTRVLPNGDWVVANVSAGSLVLVDGKTGGQTTILSGLAYPNGVEVDYDGTVFVAENDGGRIRQINPYTGDQATIATGLSWPNGVILSPDSQTLYIGSFGGGVIYAMDRLGPDTWDTARVIVNSPGFDFGFDGIHVDICNNVYFTEYIRGLVYRISNVDGVVELVADLPSSWIPNMRWGHDLDNFWKSDVLFVSDRDGGRIFGLEMGIQGKPHVLNP